MTRSTDDLPRRERAALAALGTQLRAAFGARPTDLRLFGSGARGEYGPDSDLDVLALIDRLEQDDFALASRIASEVSVDEDVWIGLLPMTPEHFELLRRTEQRLARDIDSEGIAL